MRLALAPGSMADTARRLSPRIGGLLVVAVVLFGAALYVPVAALQVALWLLGGVMVALVAVVRGFALYRDLSATLFRRTIGAFVAHDAAASYVASADGEILYRNKAAQERAAADAPPTLAGELGDIFANPTAILFRLQDKARALGAAREDIVTRRGHVRLAVHRVGAGNYLWRLEDIADRPAGGRGAEALSLPMLTAGKTGAVLFMNEAFRRLLGGRVKSLDRIFRDLPVRSGAVQVVDTLDGPRNCRVVALDGAGGRQEIYLLPVSDDAPADADDAGQALFDALPVPLMKLAQDGRVLMANREARDLTGWRDTGEARLQDMVDGLGRPVGDWLRDAAAGRGAGHAEFLRLRGRDAETIVQVTLTPLAAGGEAALVAVLNDATELKTLEAQFVQSQKMQAIGQLAGGVAHDFNNLLTAISGHCDLLLLRHDQGDPDYADLVQINQNANRAASLVGQLLAFSRKQTLQPEVLDLRDTLSDLTHLLNRLVGEKVTLTLNHDPALQPIRADRRQLEQVLMNIVVNARDAMPAGGEIRIETENVTLSQPLRRDRAEVPAGDYAVVRVRDEGAGIPPDHLPKIFEPFFTTKRTGEGTGLGLSTAYGIVKQTGGFIFADSVPGLGTTFSLYFPVHAAPLPLAPRAEAGLTAPPPDAPGEGVVLLVEDEEPVRAFASRALRLRGYTVLEADSAEAALKTLEDKDLDVDLFVTDVIMPGKDGPSWVREALSDRPGVKVVFVSGYAEGALGEEQAEIPGAVFLPKPFSLNDLTSLVHKQLH